MYFDNVFWGNNVYGLRAASLSYFGKEPDSLTDQQYVLLITLLRGPNLYLTSEDKLTRRYNLLNKLLLNRNLLKRDHYLRNIETQPTITYQGLDSVRGEIIPYIDGRVDEKNLKIDTTIDVNIQRSVDQFVKGSPYPLAVVVFYKNKLCAIHSTYGHDYPITYKSNVGSALKPFLYVFFRENGIECTDLFRSSENDFDRIREGNPPTKPFYTLEEGLLYSNNNVFINAAQKVGLKKTFTYLSELLGKDLSEISLATILGSTESGLSLFELTRLYSGFFAASDGKYKDECLEILKRNASSKWDIDSLFYLKTGTTNGNKQNFAIAGDLDLVLGVLRQDERAVKKVKDSSLTQLLKQYLQRNKELYRWVHTRK